VTKLYKTHGTNHCTESRRRKRAAELDDGPYDDYIIDENDLPIPEAPDLNQPLPPFPTWPTPSGITEQEAMNNCRRVIESFPAINICREYVDVEQLVSVCVLNTLVCNTSLNMSCCLSV